MQQHEITRRIPLLNPDGSLNQPGYAKTQLPAYRRRDIKASRARIKEWDYYLIMNDRFALALTVSDNGYMGLDSVSVLDLTEGWEITRSPMSVMPMGRKHMPEQSDFGDVVSTGKGYGLYFRNFGDRRVLVAQMDKFGDHSALYARVELTDIPPESMVIATPFAQPGHFYYNQKINCMRASGTVDFEGRTYAFDPAESFAVLDWGRGVWPYENTWYWGSGSGLAEGVPFGFNLGYGFGDTSAATENMLFYDGRAHKLGQITFRLPQDRRGRPQFMEPWQITSDDGRFEMDFVPVFDRAANLNVRLLKSVQNQVFGRFTGTAILDDGRAIRVEDFMGFCEKVENKW